MTDSSTITRRSNPASSPIASQRTMDAGQLATLRSVLLGPLYQELETLRARVAELEDAHQQAARLAEHLPQALALRPSPDPEMHAALAPLLDEALRKQRSIAPRHPARGLTSHLRHCLTAPATFARSLWHPRHQPAEAEILGLLLVHRASRTVIEQFMRPVKAPRESHSIASMLALLQQRLCDETFLTDYEKLESLRIEDITYGIHAGPLAILFSVTRGKSPTAALARCKSALESMHRQHATTLSPFHAAANECHLIPSDLRPTFE